MLKACLNGSRLPDEHPALPVTAEQLAEAAAAAAAAGADAVHLHVKDAAGRDTFDPLLHAAAVTAVRALAPGLPVGVTTGAWAEPDPGTRVRMISSWTVLPDFASVNWHEDGAEEVAAALLGRGIGVEAGLWTPPAVAAWLRSALQDRCLRVLLEVQDEQPPTGHDSPGSTPDDAGVASAKQLLEALGLSELPVLLHGEGATAWPVLQFARLRGLDVRIGLEDTLVLPDGTPASDSAELVAAALRMAGDCRSDR